MEENSNLNIPSADSSVKKKEGLPPLILNSSLYLLRPIQKVKGNFMAGFNFPFKEPITEENFRDKPQLPMPRFNPNLDLNVLQFQVLWLLLCQVSQDNQKLQIEDKLIASKIGVSIPSIERALKALEDKDLIYRYTKRMNVKGVCSSRRFIIVNFWKLYGSKDQPERVYYIGETPLDF